MDDDNKFPYNVEVYVPYTGVGSFITGATVFWDWCRDTVGTLDEDWQYHWINEDDDDIAIAPGQSRLYIEFSFARQEDQIRFSLTYGQ